MSITPGNVVITTTAGEQPFTVTIEKEPLYAEEQPLFTEAADCPPDCEECEVESTRALALAAPDWRKLGNSVGVHPSDMRKFIEAQVCLTAPARRLLREQIAKEATA